WHPSAFNQIVGPGRGRNDQQARAFQEGWKRLQSGRGAGVSESAEQFHKASEIGVHLARAKPGLRPVRLAVAGIENSRQRRYWRWPKDDVAEGGILVFDAGFLDQDGLL